MRTVPPAATLSSSPMAASSTTRLLEPYEMKGSGTPVRGASPSTAKTLIVAWQRIIAVRPAASSWA